MLIKAGACLCQVDKAKSKLIATYLFMKSLLKIDHSVIRYKQI